VAYFFGPPCMLPKYLGRWSELSLSIQHKMSPALGGFLPWDSPLFPPEQSALLRQRLKRVYDILTGWVL